jgi:hypothetical protein
MTWHRLGLGAEVAGIECRTLVPDLTALRDAARALLSEWLDRASGS